MPLATDPIVLVSAHGNVHGDLAAYADEPWAFDVPGSYMANLATRLCRQAGFEPRVVCRFGNYMLTLKHVEAGLAVAVLPRAAGGPAVRGRDTEAARHAPDRGGGAEGLPCRDHGCAGRAVLSAPVNPPVQ